MGYLQASERFEQFDKTFSVCYRYIFLLLNKFRGGTVAIALIENLWRRYRVIVITIGVALDLGSIFLAQVGV